MLGAPRIRESAVAAWPPRWCWAVALALVALAFPLDASVDRALLLVNHPDWHRFAWWCSRLGEWWIIALGGVVVAALAIWRGQTERAHAILTVVGTSGLTGLSATILRTLTGRTRPSNHDVPQGFYGIYYHGHFILGRPEFSSFPSGHSATVAGLAIAAWWLDRRAGVVAWIFAALVIWSRIATDWHHLSDVVASLVLAWAGALVIWRWLPPLLRVWLERWR